MDVTMCLNHNCPIKHSCLRYTAKPDTYQSYFVDNPCEIIDDWWYCEYFLQNTKHDNSRLHRRLTHSEAL